MHGEGEVRPNFVVGSYAGANIGDDSQVLRLVRDLVVFNGKRSVIQANVQAWKVVDLNAAKDTV